MLYGYATALFRLGRRYERALGADRNLDEAARCYFKAAKLGNLAGFARLAPSRGNAPNGLDASSGVIRTGS